MASIPRPTRIIEHNACDSPPSERVASLARYWTDKTAGREMCSRDDIDPVDIKPLLLDLFMVDVLHAERDYRYRLVGTRVAEMRGRDFTGMRLSALIKEDPAGYVRIVEFFDSVVAGRRPAYATGKAFWLPKRSYLDFSVGYFPLSQDGTRVDVLLALLDYKMPP